MRRPGQHLNTTDGELVVSVSNLRINLSYNLVCYMLKYVLLVFGHKITNSLLGDRLFLARLVKRNRHASPRTSDNFSLVELLGPVISVFEPLIFLHKLRH